MWPPYQSVERAFVPPTVLSSSHYRIVPAALGESLLVSARLARELGGAEVIDRALCPRFDVVDASIAPHALMSERLARALEAHKVPGVRILGELPHATPNDVAGWKLMRVDVAGSAGVVHSARPAQPDFVPLTPGMRLELEDDAQLLGYTPWLGHVDRAFRQLVIRRELLVELARELGDLRVFLAPAGRDEPPVAWPVSAVRPLEESTPVLAQALTSLRDELGLGDALRLLHADEAGEIGAVLDECDGRAPDETPFAAFRGDGVVWLVDARGHVSAAGLDGVRYGPDAPFARWLADQTADLRYFREHPFAPGRSVALSQ